MCLLSNPVMSFTFKMWKDEDYVFKLTDRLKRSKSVYFFKPEVKNKKFIPNDLKMGNHYKLYFYLINQSFFIKELPSFVRRSKIDNNFFIGFPGLLMTGQKHMVEELTQKPCAIFSPNFPNFETPFIYSHGKEDGYEINLWPFDKKIRFNQDMENYIILAEEI